MTWLQSIVKALAEALGFEVELTRLKRPILSKPTPLTDQDSRLVPRGGWRREHAILWHCMDGPNGFRTDYFGLDLGGTVGGYSKGADVYKEVLRDLLFAGLLEVYGANSYRTKTAKPDFGLPPLEVTKEHIVAWEAHAEHVSLGNENKLGVWLGDLVAHGYYRGRSARVSYNSGGDTVDRTDKCRPQLSPTQTEYIVERDPLYGLCQTQPEDYNFGE